MVLFLPLFSRVPTGQGKWNWKMPGNLIGKGGNCVSLGRKCAIIERILEILPNFKQYMKCVDEELELQILVKSI